MVTKLKKPCIRWTIVAFVVGIATASVVIHSLSAPEPCPEPPPCPPVLGTIYQSCFDAKTLNDLFTATGAPSARFYLSKSDGGALAVLVSPITEEGRHAPDASGKLTFLQFKAIEGSGTEMSGFDDTGAQAAVKASATTERDPWSIDVRKEVLDGLLSVSDANGIGMKERELTDGNWSFELSPVQLSSGEASPVGSDRDIRVGAAPCPMHCPFDAAYYLHLAETPRE